MSDALHHGVQELQGLAPVFVMTSLPVKNTHSFPTLMDFCNFLYIAIPPYSEHQCIQYSSNTYTLHVAHSYVAW